MCFFFFFLITLFVLFYFDLFVCFFYFHYYYYYYYFGGRGVSDTDDKNGCHIKLQYVYMISFTILGKVDLPYTGDSCSNSYLGCSSYVHTCYFSYLIQENSTGRGVPTFSVWYRACLSGTARACLVPRVPVWYRLSGTPFCSFTSVTMTSQRKAQRFPRRQKGKLLACFSLKCISQRGTRRIIKSQC